VKDLNIIDLINDYRINDRAMRERKTVKTMGRNQFARVFRVLNIPSALMRNKRLLFTHDVTVNNVKLRPRASFTPFISKARRLYQVPRRSRT